MIWIIILLILSYDLFLIWITAGWEKLTYNPSGLEEYIFITVIVPVRNEADNIDRLIDDLEDQNYPKQKYEVLVIDDQSTDDTRRLVVNRQKECSIKLILVDLKNQAPQSFSSKKAAINLGVNLAQGELIIITDGDSRIGTNLLSIYAQYFDRDNSKLIAGPVFMCPGKSFFSSVQSIEFASLIGTGAALFSLGYPALCNGANLAFTREVFREVEGYLGNEEVISGDDEFLLYKISKKYPGGVSFIKSREALVYTPPHRTVKEFIQQRKRWAGKWKKHGNRTNILLALFIFFTHLGILAGFILTLLGQIPFLIFGTLIFVKILMEYRLIHDIFTFANKKISIGAFLIMSLLYSFYALIFGITANIGGYTWKGRHYKN